MNNDLSLDVTVPAAEWARMQRRLRYLEAAIVQAYRGRRRLKEWFSASELAAIRLPGLPGTRQGIFRKAQHQEWLYRTTTGLGGERFEFHFSSLPKRSFDELIERILAPRVESPASGETAPLLPIPARPASLPRDERMAPSWVLPLMRMLRGGLEMDPDDILRRLRESLPTGADLPTRDEVKELISQHISRRM